MRKDELVFVRDVAPDIGVELKYATTDNFTGRVIYGFTEPRLRYGTALKLREAQRRLSALGFKLKVWDAFRPVSAQFKLWEAVPDPTFVADPTTGFSSHSRGSAVDVTLTDLDGRGVPMPTEFDDFSPSASRALPNASPEAAANSRLMERIMLEVGFRPYSAEWWHFTDTDEYPVFND